MNFGCPTNMGADMGAFHVLKIPDISSDRLVRTTLEPRNIALYMLNTRYKISCVLTVIGQPFHSRYQRGLRRVGSRDLVTVNN